MDAGDPLVQIGTDVGAAAVRVEDVDAVPFEVNGWAEFYGTSTLSIMGVKVELDDRQHMDGSETTCLDHASVDGSGTSGSKGEESDE